MKLLRQPNPTPLYISISLLLALSAVLLIISSIIHAGPYRRPSGSFSISLSRFKMAAAGSNVLPTLCSSAVVVLSLNRPRALFFRPCSRHDSMAAATDAVDSHYSTHLVIILCLIRLALNFICYFYLYAFNCATAKILSILVIWWTHFINNNSVNNNNDDDDDEINNTTTMSII